MYTYTVCLTVFHNMVELLRPLAHSSCVVWFCFQDIRFHRLFLPPHLISPPFLKIGSTFTSGQLVLLTYNATKNNKNIYF